MTVLVAHELLAHGTDEQELTVEQALLVHGKVWHDEVLYGIVAQEVVLLPQLWPPQGWPPQPWPGGPPGGLPGGPLGGPQRRPTQPPVSVATASVVHETEEEVMTAQDVDEPVVVSHVEVVVQVGLAPVCVLHEV